MGRFEFLAQPPPGVSITQAARLTGISRSTLHRITGGQVEPSLGTLRELAILHGLDLDVRLVPLSDPDAAAAVRVLLEPLDVPEEDAGVVAWIERLRRIPGDDERQQIVAAATASSLLHRSDAVFLRGAPDAMRLASAGWAHGGAWALSGLAMVRARDDLVTGPSVLWVDDLAVAGRLLDTHSRTESSSIAHVIVAKAHPSVFANVIERDGMRYVTPLQLIVDCLGLGGELDSWARAEMAAWQW